VARLAAQAFERSRLFEAERRARETAERERAAADEARRRAVEASEAKSRFLAVMSHELRTPLNAIAGHVQLVDMGLHGPVTREQREALDRVARAQRHLLDLITDVLDFAKLEAGHAEFDVRPVALAEVVTEAAALVEPQRLGRHLAYSARLPAALPAVLADREKLRRVLINLLANAVKFTPPGGRVAVEAESDGSQVRVHVRDTGIGIPAGRLAAVFDPFVQAHGGANPLARPHEGTGLGLAISRDLARGMGGDLTAASEEGRGSTFTVTLRPAEAGEGSSPGDAGG
jgi:signal transduction histidine kinase